MNKKILFQSLFSCFLMLILPCIGAMEQNLDSEYERDEQIHLNLVHLLKIGTVRSLFSSIFLVIFSFLFGWGVAKVYTSRTVYVDDDAPEDWYDYMHVKSIQEGINHARMAYANNVRVFDGTYQEAITIPLGFFEPGQNMGLWLIGNGSETTIIDAGGNDYGINLNQVSGWSRVIGFTITNASVSGINIGKSQWNFITENTLKENEIGIKNEKGRYSPIWKNTFLDNEIHAFDTGENVWSFDWYGDIPMTGNYYDDYTGVDNDGDGIGDTMYEIDGGNSVDSHPLMQPWSGD